MAELRRPVISFSTSKGGSGKTTLCIALAGVLANEGGKVAMIDTDPQQSLMEWGQKPGKPDNIDVFSAQDEETLIDLLEACEQSHQVIIIDVQGRVSELGNTAMAWSKLVVIPVQPSAFDAAGAANTIRALSTVARARRADIKYATVMNRMSGAIKSRTAESVMDAFRDGGIPIMGQFIDREAYRIMTASGGTVFTLTKKQAPGLTKAQDESVLFAMDVANMVGLIGKGEGTPPSATTPEQMASALERAGELIENSDGDDSPDRDATLRTKLKEKISGAAA